MQQHYPAGHMFLSTRWRKSNSRWAQMSHFFFLKSSVFHTVNYKTLNICRQLAASQSEVSGSKRSCASQHSDAHTAIRLIDLSQHFERLRVERVEEWRWGGGGGGFPRMPSSLWLSHSLSSPLPLSAWRGATASEGMGTDGKENTVEQHRRSASHFLFALPVSLPVWSVQLCRPIGLRPRSSSVLHGWLDVALWHFSNATCSASFTSLPLTSLTA